MAIAFEHLVKAPNGEARIVGRRLTAYDILCQHELGETPARIAEAFDLSLSAVYEALAYALGHSDEMKRIREANKAAERHVLMRIPAQLRRGIPLP